jgi:23S rRNA (cytosine1962-C5)-methyltransferase
MGRNRAIISEKGKKRIVGGHRWVFKSDITNYSEIESDLVYVFDSKNRFVGTALFSKDSQIALRFISFEEITDLEHYIESAIVEAQNFRDGLKLSGDCYRIVHSESDGLPGLIVDRYSDTIVFQTLTRPMENLKDVIIKKIRDVLNPLQIFEKNDTKTRNVEGLPLLSRTVYGTDRRGLFCTENHHIFYVDLVESQKTGEFLDQKINRAIVNRYSKGRVLDLFCYHGWFGCNIKDYEEIISVDTSEPALRIAERNFVLNNRSRYKLLPENVFDFLRTMESRGELFDTIILDPPGFIKSKSQFKQGYGGYKEINLRAMKILRKGGILATFSCSYYMNDEEFKKMVMDAAIDTKSEFVILEHLRQSPDHRELLLFPESHYLKGLLLRKV